MKRRLSMLSIESRRGVVENLVQTDTSINPGNSGGPLVDLEGRVVATNTAIIPYAHGIGFAISINVAKRCSIEILKHGSIVRPWLGMSGLSINRSLSSYYGLPIDRGILVMRVVPEGPAGRAGLRPRDIILGINGVEVREIKDLVREIQRRKAGDIVKIVIARDSRRRILEARLEKTP